METVFSANAFSREYTERYTYEHLIATLNQTLGADGVTAFTRAGAAMGPKQILKLARSASISHP